MSSVFDEKSAQPTQETLGEVLKETTPLWAELLTHSAGVKPGLKREWKFYGKKHGWQLKVLDKRRAAFYMIPHHGSFLVGMALRPPAVEAVLASDLPQELREEISEAKTYPEGRPARVEVRGATEAELVKTLISLKLNV